MASLDAVLFSQQSKNVQNTGLFVDMLEEAPFWCRIIFRPYLEAGQNLNFLENPGNRMMVIGNRSLDFRTHMAC